MDDDGDDEEGGEASLMILKRRTDRPRPRTHRLSDHKHYADDGVGADGDGDEDGSISDFTPVKNVVV